MACKRNGGQGRAKRGIRTPKGIGEIKKGGEKEKDRQKRGKDRTRPAWIKQKCNLLLGNFFFDGKKVVGFLARREIF